MADLIALHAGTLPWQPSDDARLVAEYHRHDTPLVGIVHQHDVDYLFQCLAGELEHVNLWLYTAVSSQELAALEEAEGERIEQLLDELSSNRYGMAALGIEGYGLIEWTPVDQVTPNGIQHAISTLIEQFEERLRLMKETERDVQRLAEPV